MRFGARTRLEGGPLGSRVGLWGNRKLIRSVQRATITLAAVTSNTATITAVNTAISELRWLGTTFNAVASDQGEQNARLELTNSTTVTATRADGANTLTISFEVIEYYPWVVKSIQRGTIATSTTNTATITAVDVNKSALSTLGYTSNAAGDARLDTRLNLTNSTTVTSTLVGDGAATTTVAYQVVEFW